MSEILNLDALCRCCHADGDFKSLQAPYVHDGAIEIYAVMLRDALGIHINPSTIEASYTICEGCIDQLRIALKFKKQVIACEKTFEEYCKNELTKHTSTSSLVKMEMEYDNALSPNLDNNDDNYDDDDDDDDDVDDSDGGYTEVKQKTKGSKKQEENTPVTCKFCKEMFTNSSSLRTHMLSHILDEDGVTCKFCKITFKRRGLFRHLTKHESMGCSFCIEVFLSVEELKTHEHAHIELTGYVCDYCKMGFKNKATLAKHMKLHREVYEKFICDWCGRAFNMAHNLRQHISAVHQKIKPFQCDQCQRYFSTKAILNYHYKSHTGERPVKCPLCPKRFKTIGELNQHTDKHHRKDDERDDDVCNNDGGDDDGGDGKVVSDDGGEDSDGGYDLNNDSDKEIQHEKGRVEIKLEEETNADDVKIKECIDDDDDDEDYTNNDVSNEYEDAIEDDKEIEEEIKPEKVYVKPETKRKSRKTGKKIGHNAHPHRYSCVICNEILSSKPKLRSHIKTKHIPQDSSDFPCPSCDITFKGRDTFIQHMKLRHEKAEYHCAFCTDKFPTFKSLNAHKATHNTEAICDYCQKSFKNKFTLLKHIRLHTGSYKEYICETCGVVMKNATNLKMHIRSVHDKLRPFKCDQCPKTYTLKKHLIEHIRIHTGELPYECPVCSKRFRCKTVFNVHKRGHLKPEGTKRRRSKATTNTIQYNIETHPHQCDTCGKRFVDKSHLNSHKNTHTRPFNCDVCGKRFGYKHLLNHHRKTLHDGTPQPTERLCRGVSVCKICNKNYYNWEIHKRVHEKKPFSCHLCHKIYSEQKTLDWHMNVKHLKDRKYVCQFCQKDFTRLDALKTHLLRKHDSSRERKKKEKKSKCKKNETQQSPVKVEAVESDFDSVLPVYAININEVGSSDYDYSSVRDAQDVLGI